MVFRIGKNALKAAPSSQEDKAETAVISIQENLDIDAVINSLHAWGVEHNLGVKDVLHTNEKKFLDKFKKKELGNQLSDFHYTEINHMIQRIVFQLKNNNNLAEEYKISVFKNLMVQLDACGPGIYETLQQIEMDLKVCKDVPQWLERLRAGIVLQIANEINSINYGYEPGMHIHIISACKIFIKELVQPPSETAEDKPLVPDHYRDRVIADGFSHAFFNRRFAQLYSSDAILNAIISDFTNHLYDELKHIHANGVEKYKLLQASIERIFTIIDAEMPLDTLLDTENTDKVEIVFDMADQKVAIKPKSIARQALTPYILRHLMKHNVIEPISLAGPIKCGRDNHLFLYGLEYSYVETSRGLLIPHNDYISDESNALDAVTKIKASTLVHLPTVSSLVQSYTSITNASFAHIFLNQSFDHPVFRGIRGFINNAPNILAPSVAAVTLCVLSIPLLLLGIYKVGQATVKTIRDYSAQPDLLNYRLRPLQKIETLMQELHGVDDETGSHKIFSRIKEQIRIIENYKNDNYPELERKVQQIKQTIQSVKLNVLHSTAGIYRNLDPENKGEKSDNKKGKKRTPESDEKDERSPLLPSSLPQIERISDPPYARRYGSRPGE